MALTFFAVSVSAGGGGLEPGENEALPYFGRFYGTGLGAANAGVGNTNFNRRYMSFFFWGERTAVVAGWRWHIRYGSGYSAGDGGIYTVRIVEADPNTRLPKFPLVTISQVANYFPSQKLGINTATGAGFTYDEVTFTTQGQTVAKQPYCLLFENTHSDRSNNFVATNHDRPWSYFDDQGGPPYAVDETFYNPARIHLPGGQVRAWFPWPVGGIGNTPGEMFLRYRRLGHPLIDIRYGDGIYGVWGIHSSSSSSNYTYVISGDDHLRDRFRVSRASRVIDEISIWPFRQTGSSGNLVVTLEQGPASETSGNGTVLEQWSVPLSQIFSIGNRLVPIHNEGASGAQAHDEIPYITLPLSQPRTLQLGQIYNLRLRSTGANVLYRRKLGAEREGNFSPIANSWVEHEAQRRLSWLAGEDSRGSQRSSNGGSSWTYLSNRARIGWLARCVLG